MEAYQLALDEFNTSSLYRENRDPHHHGTFTYDAVWAVSLAMHRADLDLK